MLDTVVISGEDVYCSVVSGTLLGESVFSVIWSEFLMPSDISWLRSSVYECQRVVCAFTSPTRSECGMFVMCCICSPSETYGRKGGDSNFQLFS